VAAYAELMEDPDPLVRAKAANAWCAWEDAVISLESNGKPNAYSDRPPAALLALVRICTHTSPTARGWKRARCCAAPTAWPASRAC
jgi:hypothetical protein